MNRAEFARWLAGIRPAPHAIYAVDESGVETLMAQLKGPNRWTRVANTMFERKAVRCLCKDKTGALIDQSELGDEDDDAPMASVSPDVLTSLEGRTFTAAEVAAILAQAQVRTVEVTANAITRAVERTMVSTSQMNSTAFSQLSDVTKTLVQHVNELREQAADAIAREREELDEKRDEEKSGAKMEGLLWKLFEKMGPEGLKDIASVMGGMNGSPSPKKVTVEAKPANGDKS